MWVSGGQLRVLNRDRLLSGLLRARSISLEELQPREAVQADCDQAYNQPSSSAACL